MSESKDEADEAESAHENDKMKPFVSHKRFCWVGGGQVQNKVISICERTFGKLMCGRVEIY